MRLKTHEDKIEVRDSGIHGLGIFALTDIGTGELLLLIEGELIDEQESLRREKEENNVYIFWNGINYIDTVRSEKIKYINHSCLPNCIVSGRSRKYLKLISSQPISQGEELTIDYGYDEIYAECNCSVCAAGD